MDFESGSKPVNQTLSAQLRMNSITVLPNLFGLMSVDAEFPIYASNKSPLQIILFQPHFLSFLSSSDMKNCYCDYDLCNGAMSNGMSMASIGFALATFIFKFLW